MHGSMLLAVKNVSQCSTILPELQNRLTETMTGIFSQALEGLRESAALIKQQMQVKSALRKVTGLNFKYGVDGIAGYVWQPATKEAYDKVNEQAEKYLRRNAIKLGKRDNPIVKAIEHFCVSGGGDEIEANHFMDGRIYYGQPLERSTAFKEFVPPRIIIFDDKDSHLRSDKELVEFAERLNAGSLFKNGNHKAVPPSLHEARRNCSNEEAEKALFKLTGLQFKCVENSDGYGEYIWEPNSEREMNAVLALTSGCEKKSPFQHNIVAAIEDNYPHLEGIFYDGGYNDYGYALVTKRLPSDEGFAMKPYIGVLASSITPDFLDFVEKLKAPPLFAKSVAHALHEDARYAALFALTEEGAKSSAMATAP